MELKLNIIILFLVNLSLIQAKKTHILGKTQKGEADWLKHAVIYQIYPRSFKDTSGDGIGDLIGIKNKLDYFVEIGIDAIWMSPIYTSPMKDFGYDISDFVGIDPLFGTMEDFESLVDEAHIKNIKIIMDFVPNHSSNQHDWFEKSVLRIDPYTDYYVWADSRGYDNLSNPIPPNNWVSVFRYSAWEYNVLRGQFYLHQFLAEQPDLNYNEQAIIEEMKNILIFWMDKGVDGFRFDAVAFLYEDPELPDEPKGDTINNPDPNDYYHWDHIYTFNLPQSRDILSELYQTIQDYGGDRVSMLEVYLPTDEIIPYYECGEFPFNFNLIEGLPTGEPVKAYVVENIINNWMDNIPQESSQIANWVLGNHDNWRVGSRLGEEMIDILNTVVMTLPGVVITYQGEEIGMLNNDNISWEQTMDQSGCNCGIENYNSESCSRDPERTPFQWDNSENAGFTLPGITPWLPINDNYQYLNVEIQKEDELSHLSIYKNLTTIRKESKTFIEGDLITNSKDNVLYIERKMIDNSEDHFLSLINFSDDEITIDSTLVISGSYKMGYIKLSTKSSGVYGNVIDLEKIQLKPYEALILLLQ